MHFCLSLEVCRNIRNSTPFAKLMNVTTQGTKLVMFFLYFINILLFWGYFLIFLLLSRFSDLQFEQWIYVLLSVAQTEQKYLKQYTATKHMMDLTTYVAMLAMFFLYFINILLFWDYFLIFLLFISFLAFIVWAKVLVSFLDFQWDISWKNYWLVIYSSSKGSIHFCLSLKMSANIWNNTPLLNMWWMQLRRE